MNEGGVLEAAKGCGQFLSALQTVGPQDDLFFQSRQCYEALSCIMEEGSAIVVHSFVGRATTRVTQREADRLSKMVSRADIKALYRRDTEYAPFCCPRCTTWYCGDHWVRWDVFEDNGWHDAIRGRCPSGHERMLEDES